MCSTRLIKAREPIGDPKLLVTPPPVNPKYADVPSRLLGQTGTHVGNVKEQKDYSHEIFRRVTRTELIDTLAYILKKQNGTLERSSVTQDVVNLASKAVMGPEYLPPSGRRGSESKSNATPVSGAGVRSVPRSVTPSRLRSGAGTRPSSNTAAGTSSSPSTALLSTFLPMTAGFQRVLPDDCEIYLIDVRDEAAYAMNHLFGAVSYPVLQLRRGIITPDLFSFKQGARRAVVVYGGHESYDSSPQEAAELLVGKYFDNVFLLTGGIEGVAERFPDWIIGELPAVRGMSGLGSTLAAGTPVYGVASGTGTRPGSRTGSGMGRRTPVPVPGLTDTIGQQKARAQAIATAIGPPTQEAFNMLQVGIYPYAKNMLGQDITLRPIFQVRLATPAVARDGGTSASPSSASVQTVPHAPGATLSMNPGRSTPSTYYTMPGGGRIQAPQQFNYSDSAAQHPPSPSATLRSSRDKHLGSGLVADDQFDPKRDTYVSVYQSTTRQVAGTPVAHDRATPAVPRSEKNASHWSFTDIYDPARQSGKPVLSEARDHPSPSQPVSNSHQAQQPQPMHHQPQHPNQLEQQDLHLYQQFNRSQQSNWSDPPQTPSESSFAHEHYQPQTSQPIDPSLPPEVRMQLLEQQIRDLQMQLTQGQGAATTQPTYSNSSPAQPNEYQSYSNPSSGYYASQYQVPTQSYARPVLRGNQIRQ